jgi:hypothetical protein
MRLACGLQLKEEQHLAAQLLIKPEETVDTCQKMMLTHRLATMPMKSARQNRTRSCCNES